MKSFRRLALGSLLAVGLSGAPPSSATPVEEFALWQQRHRSLPAAEAAAPGHVARGVELARQRARQLQELLEQDPAGFVRQAMPAAERDRLPAAVQAHIERAVQGRGFFGVYCALPHDHNDPAAAAAHRDGGFAREAILDGMRYRVFVYGKWRDQTTARNLQVAGIALGQSLVIGEAPTGAEQPAAAAQEEPAAAPSLVGTNTVLYIIARFSDQVSYPISVADATNRMNVVSSFFGNNSGGVVGLRGLVNPNQVVDTVEVTLPQPASYASTYNNNFAQLLSDARAAALSNGFNYADYNLDVTVTTSSGFSYAGRAYVSGQGAHLVSGYTTLRTAGHELGHNFGLWHANYWRTDANRPFGQDSVPSGYVSDLVDDEWVEYGHYFSVMSAQSGGELDDATKPHFAAAEKVRLNWLSGAAVGYATSNGTYRLFRHDHRESINNPRAIRIETAATDYTGQARRYWLNYRYAPWTSAQNYVRNGLQIDVARTSYSSDGAVQLDMTPFSNDATTYIDQANKPGGYWTVDNNDKYDGTLIVGRTYSDPAAGIHITPIATGALGTNQEYIDCVINLGTFPGNRPPAIQDLTASSLQLGTGQNVTLAVTATDPDGDPLAYSWQFDQGATWNAAGLNTNVALKSWPTAGQYRVQVTVSDHKGGISSESLIVTVGNPANTRQVWGRVLWGGQPVANARINTNAAGTGAPVWTDSNGTYVLTDLPANNNLTLSSRYDGLSFTPQFSNPVNLTTGNAYGMDFHANELFGGGGGGGSTSYLISGQVTDGSGTGVAGAEVQAGGLFTLTDPSGNYTLSNFPSGNYTVAAQYLDWTFSPASGAVSITSTNSTGNNFARSGPHSIAGRVDGPPAGPQDRPPTVYLSNGRNVPCTRSGTGNNKHWAYTLDNLPPGTYWLSAELSGYSIAPNSFTNPVVVAVPLVGYNLLGSAGSVAGAISGLITASGLPVSNVVIGVNGSTPTQTDTDGRYRADNLATGIYTITPSKPGYSFSPVSRIVSNLPASGIDFAASTTNSPPQITDLTATPAVLASPAGLSSLAATATGAAPLQFAWAALAAPGPVGFTANNSSAASNTVASFVASGLHTFRLRVTDANGLSATATVAVVVNSQAAAGQLAVRPYEVFVAGGGTVNFSAQAWDSQGNPIASNPLWQSTAGGSIASNGLFSAELAGGGPYAVIATDGSLSATGFVWVVAEPITNAIISVTASQPAAAEFGLVAGQFSLTRTGNTSNTVTVGFTWSGSASNSLDYTASAASVVFSSGVTAASITLTPLADTLAEASETAILNLTANPAQYQLGASSNATITIADLPIDHWRTVQFGSDANTPARAGDLADPDGDGVENLAEYAFGLNPLSADAGALPGPQTEGQYLTLTYRQSKNAPDVTITVEACGDLQLANWSSAGLVEQPPVDAGAHWTIEVRDHIPIADADSRFLRVRVSR